MLAGRGFTQTDQIASVYQYLGYLLRPSDTTVNNDDDVQ